MAFDAGSITGRLDLNTTSFKDGMNEAHTHTETKAGEIRESLETIAESLTEVVGPAFGQLGNQIQSVLAGFSEGPILGSLNAVATGAGMLREAVESVGDQYEQMGIQADKLGVPEEYFSRMAAAAQSVHISAAQLGNAFFILNRQAAAAVDGDTGAAKGFENLKISTQDLATHLGDTQWIIDTVIDKLDHLPNAAQRGRVSMELLSRGARDMAPFLRLSREEIKNLGDEAEKLNAVTTEVQKKTGENIGRMEAYWDQFKHGLEKSFVDPIISKADPDAVAHGLESTKGAIDSTMDWFHHVGEHPTDPNGGGIFGNGLLYAAWGKIVDTLGSCEQRMHLTCPRSTCSASQQNITTRRIEPAGFLRSSTRDISRTFLLIPLCWPR